MTAAEEIKSLQAQIARLLEERQAVIERYVAVNVTSFSSDVKQWIASIGALGVSEPLFERAKSYAPPAGWRSLLFKQSEKDKQLLAELLESLKAIIVAKCMTSATVEVTADIDSQLKRLNMRLTELAKWLEVERRKPQTKPAVKGYTHGPASWRNKRAETSTPVIESNFTDSVNLNMLTTTVIVNSQVQVDPPFVSGQGGDFGGAGATGSWDDQGASNFS